VKFNILFYFIFQISSFYHFQLFHLYICDFHVSIFIVSYIKNQHFNRTFVFHRKNNIVLLRLGVLKLFI